MSLRRRHRRYWALHAGSSFYDPLLDLLVVPGGEGGTEVFHEWIHLLDHVSTSYGCMIDELVLCSARGWGQILEQARESGISIPVPLSGILTDDFHFQPYGDKADDLGSVEQLQLAALSEDLFMGLLEAMDGLEPDVCTEAPIVGGLALLERMSEGNQSFPTSTEELQSLPVWEVPEALYPDVVWREETAEMAVGIGAVALMEGRAMLFESALVDDDLAHFGEAFKQKKPEYIAALLVACERVADLGEHAESYGYPTFLALSDLALMTPAAPSFAGVRAERLWRDVHPGYRFMQLMDLIPEAGHYDKETDPYDYQSRFCELLGWPDPREVLEHGARLGGDDHRTARRRKAFELKLTNPEIFGVGRMPEDADAFTAVLDLFEPQVCIWEGDELAVVIDDDDKDGALALAERVGYAYLFDFGGRIMDTHDPMGEEVDWVTALGQRFDLGAQGTLRDFYDGIYAKSVSFRPLTR